MPNLFEHVHTQNLKSAKTYQFTTHLICFYFFVQSLVYACKLQYRISASKVMLCGSQILLLKPISCFHIRSL